MSNRLAVPVHSIKHFTKCKDKLVAEISSVPRPVARRVFNDACDLGFRVQDGPFTTLYTFHREVRSEVDNELISTHFTKSDSTMSRFAEVILFND